MSETKAIIIRPEGTGFAVAIPGEALRQKAQALELASGITQVTNADEQEFAIGIVATLKGLSSGAEKTREQIKKPYFQAGKAIDAKAKEYVKEIDERVSVIERQIGAFQAEQRRAQAEREQAEIRRRQEAEAEAQRERDRLAKIEADRAEAERLATEAKTKKGRDAAAAEAARLAQEQTLAEIDAAEAEDAAADASAIIYTPEPPAATGAAIRETVDFEVTDIEAFYEWDKKRRMEAAFAGRILPQFIKVEVRRGDFKQFINLCDDATLNSIPGVTFTRETKAAVRAAVPTLALQ